MCFKLPHNQRRHYAHLPPHANQPKQHRTSSSNRLRGSGQRADRGQATIASTNVVRPPDPAQFLRAILAQPSTRSEAPISGGPWAVQLQKSTRLGGYGRFTQDTEGHSRQGQETSKPL